MARRSIRVVNRSPYESARITSACDAMEKAIRIQLREVAKAWGEYVWDVVDDAGQRGFEIALLDHDDSPDTLGYHDLMHTNGIPYARVYIDPIMQSKGTWLRGAKSVSVTASHEACEMVGDPTANHWVENARGALVASELCDPVESCAYTITIPANTKSGGRRVSVSDFVYPDWFNPYVPPGTPVDRMGKVRKPFEIATDGYVIHHTNTGVRNIWGRTYPHWRKAAKRQMGSRTHTRHQMG